jgi:hypothetical protein
VTRQDCTGCWHHEAKAVQECAPLTKFFSFISRAAGTKVFYVALKVLMQPAMVFHLKRRIEALYSSDFCEVATMRREPRCMPRSQRISIDESPVPAHCLQFPRSSNRICGLLPRYGRI